MTVSSPFKSLLLVIKRTAYEAYTNRRTAGEIFPAVRWDRLKARYETHTTAVAAVKKFLDRRGVRWTEVARDELSSAHLAANKVDLVLALGGDGTTLIASHILTSDIPLLGINTDPSPLRDLSKMYLTHLCFDERRSTGHLCGATRHDAEVVLDRVLGGETTPTTLARLRVIINGIPLSPVLNDVMVAHPSPAAVSRYSVRLPKRNGGDRGGNTHASAHKKLKEEDTFRLASPSSSSSLSPSSPPVQWFHVRSSGLRVCTASGSTAAMRSAGGLPMHYTSKRLQFMDREPIYHDHVPPPSSGHGFYEPDQEMHLRWNSRCDRRQLKTLMFLYVSLHFRCF